MKSTIGLTTVNRDNQSFRKADDTPFDFRKGDFVVIVIVWWFVGFVVVLCASVFLDLDLSAVPCVVDFQCTERGV